MSRNPPSPPQSSRVGAAASGREGRRAVVFAGGGTGGHIFPGLAISEELGRIAIAKCLEIRCLFAVSRRALDSQILSGIGAEFEVIPAEPLSLRPRGMLRFVSSWGKAVRTSRALLARLKQECAGGVQVAAMGGFVAAPFVQAAKVERVPVMLVNLDAVPGRANRWIAGRAAAVYSAAPVEADDLGPAARVHVIPPIVRSAAIAPGSPQECRRLLGLDPGRPTLMVTGASQGAKSINGFVAALVTTHAAQLLAEGWQIVHQTGRGEDAAIRAVYAKVNVPAVVEPFFDRMGVLWGAADVAISRCGAGSVAEAWANGTPTVFLPYPYHKDQHQKRNAEVLVKAGAGILCDDLVDVEANLAAVGPLVLAVMRDPESREQMRSAYRGLGPADGARRIARVIADDASHSSCRVFKE